VVTEASTTRTELSRPRGFLLVFCSDGRSERVELSRRRNDDVVSCLARHVRWSGLGLSRQARSVVSTLIWWRKCQYRQVWRPRKSRCWSAWFRLGLSVRSQCEYFGLYFGLDEKTSFLGGSQSWSRLSRISFLRRRFGVVERDCGTAGRGQLPWPVSALSCGQLTGPVRGPGSDRSSDAYSCRPQRVRQPAETTHHRALLIRDTHTHTHTPV